MGEQRANNYALLAPDKKTFIDLVTEGQPPAPDYFVYDADPEPQGPRRCSTRTPMPTALDLGRGRERRGAGGALLSTDAIPRNLPAGHLAGSINVGLERSLRRVRRLGRPE